MCPAVEPTRLRRPIVRWGHCVGLAGGWASWKTPGVKAVLALSPYTQPYLVHETLGGLAAPVMYQGGTGDFGITPSLRREGGVYDASPSPTARP